MGDKRIFLRLDADGFFHFRRADLPGCTGLVLGLVIEKGIAAIRDNFNKRQGLQILIAEHGCGQFASFYVFLNHHLNIMLKGKSKGWPQFVLLLHN